MPLPAPGRFLADHPAAAGLADLLDRVEHELLPQLVVRSVMPHDPVVVQQLPQPWALLGSGNYAAVVMHPDHPHRVVKVYAPGRPGLEQEAEVYRRIGRHPAYSECHHVGSTYLVLRRLRGITLYDCLRTGVPIPPRAMEDIHEALIHARNRGLHGHDVHGRNLMLHEGRGLIVDISDFLNPEPCSAWPDLRLAYRLLYRPLIAPLGLRAPGPVLDWVRRNYRFYRRIRSPAPLR